MYLGVVSWTYEADKSGFGSGQSKDSKLRDLDRRKVRPQNLNKDLETMEPFEQSKLQRQIEYTKQSIERVEAELLAIPTVEDSVMEISAELILSIKVSLILKPLKNHSKGIKRIFNN